MYNITQSLETHLVQMPNVNECMTNIVVCVGISLDQIQTDGTFCTAV